jgi:hypothetical protein
MVSGEALGVTLPWETWDGAHEAPPSSGVPEPIEPDCPNAGPTGVQEIGSDPAGMPGPPLQPPFLLVAIIAPQLPEGSEQLQEQVRESWSPSPPSAARA